MSDPETKFVKYSLKVEYADGTTAFINPQNFIPVDIGAAAAEEATRARQIFIRDALRTREDVTSAVVTASGSLTWEIE